MKNKILIVVFVIISIVLFNINRVYAQGVTISVNNTGWIDVTSYNGKTTPSILNLRMDISGSATVIPNWSLLVRSNTLITNSEGKIVDPSKVSIRLNRMQNGPTIQQMGANTMPVPLSLSDKFIIQQSNFPIKPPTGTDNAQWVFYFDIIIAPGAYMEDLSSWQEYKLKLAFTLKDINNDFLSESNAEVDMRIRPTDTAPSGPTYSIQVNSTARNGLLEFKNMTDYVNGVSQSYPKGLSVVSETPYQVHVKTISANFETQGYTLPVSAVNLEIADSNSSMVLGKKPLSEIAEPIFSATNMDKKPRLFDIRYFTIGNDENIIKAKPASYQTTLMYTLVPQ